MDDQTPKTEMSRYVQLCVGQGGEPPLSLEIKVQVSVVRDSTIEYLFTPRRYISYYRVFYFFATTSLK